jgi:uncharacterized integral membrane protein
MVQERATDSLSPQPDRRWLSGGAVASLVGVALLLIFMIQNADSVPLDFFFWDFELPLWLVILGSAILGALVWFGLGVIRRHRRRVERRRVRGE